jgi:putative tricarboxylic transport membrane protein
MSPSSGSGGVPGDSLPAAKATPSRRFHSDVLIALGIVVFCAVIYAVTLSIPDLPPMLSSGMGPAIFPRLLLGVMVVLAGVLALLARGKAEERREPIPAMVYWTALAMLAFMGILWLGGMAVAMVVGFVGIGALWGERRWPFLVGSGVVLSAAIYLLFVRGFGVPLPRGVIGDWLF